MLEKITEFVSESGYLGVFFLMVLENIFPPIPSELIMPLAGFTAARGELNVVGVVAAGTAGSVLGTLPYYFGGKWYGLKRLKKLADAHGRLLTVSADEIEHAHQVFKGNGKRAVFFGRLIPAIRTLISVPAGICTMQLLPFLALSVAGSMIWTGALASAGYILEANYTTVQKYLDPVSKGIVALIVVGYVYRLVTHRARKS